MKKLINFFSIFLLTINIALASPIDEAMVISAHTQGINIYNTCIATPPVDPHVIAYCTTIYTVYVTTLVSINAPFPIIPATDPSPYSWSPFDICRYEVAHMVFNLVLESPYYCPTL